MSEPITALKGVSKTTSLVTVTEQGPVGMITLRGDLGDKTLIKAAVAASGVTMPQVRHCNTEGAGGMAWMSPDELLILCDYDQVQNRLAELKDRLGALHALAVNVSDARAVFEVRGPHLRDVIAKLAPVDLAADHFTPGMFRRSRFAQVPAAFWLADDTTARIICFRSVAQYMFDLLCVAAQDGSAVDHYCRTA